MITFKKFMTEETKPAPLHTELKSLGQHYYEGGGSGSVSTTLFRGGKNSHYDKVHNMLTERGYKRVTHNRYGGSLYHKDLNGGKNRSEVEVSHDKDGHVHSVSSITKLIHY